MFSNCFLFITSKRTVAIILHMTILTTTMVSLVIAASVATLVHLVLIAVAAEMHVVMDFVVIYSAALNK